MGFFRLGKKKNDVVDLTEKYEKQKEREERIKSSMNSSQGNPSEKYTPFSFFENPSQTTTYSEENMESHQSSEEKKRKFAKRISDMTNKIEDLSNQVYHLQQRIEVLEKKTGRYEY